MAKLYFYYASMNAGKSTTLLQADFNYRERGMATMLWTSALDNRGSERAIESRIGLGAEAHRFEAATDLWASVSAANAAQPLACVLIDILGDGISMIYSFYDPSQRRRGLGTYMILDAISRVKRLGLPYLYLGYWVRGSHKMDYKARFLPQERLTVEGWVLHRSRIT